MKEMLYLTTIYWITIVGITYVDASVITQLEFNDLIRDLNLSTQAAELLESRLEENNLLQTGCTKDFNYNQLLIDIAKDVEETNSTWADAWRSIKTATSHDEIFNITFNCEKTSRSSSIPESIHELRPGDFDVIASLGDTMMTGIGLESSTIMNIEDQHRGNVWCIGGNDDIDEGLVTLPNILKKFNPSIKGYSLGTGCHKSTTNFNMASRNASSGDLPQQTEKLIELFKSSDEVDLSQHWKLITIMIGLKDLCYYCKDTEKYSQNEYLENVKSAIRLLYENVPRVFINFVPVINIFQIPKPKNVICDEFWRYECPCFKPGAETERIRYLRSEYAHKITQLRRKEEFEKEDFTIVSQEFTSDLKLPQDEQTGEVDPSYYSADCFNLGSKYQEILAILLWNEMITPVQHKDEVVDDFSAKKVIKCPSQKYPFIITKKNSHGIITNEKENQENNVIIEQEKSSLKDGKNIIYVYVMCGIASTMVFSLLVTLCVYVICGKIKKTPETNGIKSASLSLYEPPEKFQKNPTIKLEIPDAESNTLLDVPLRVVPRRRSDGDNSIVSDGDPNPKSMNILKRFSRESIFGSSDLNSKQFSPALKKRLSLSRTPSKLLGRKNTEYDSRAKGNLQRKFSVDYKKQNISDMMHLMKLPEQNFKDKNIESSSFQSINEFHQRMNNLSRQNSQNSVDEESTTDM